MNNFSIIVIEYMYFLFNIKLYQSRWEIFVQFHLSVDISLLNILSFFMEVDNKYLICDHPYNISWSIIILIIV